MPLSERTSGNESLAHLVPPDQWAARVRELRAERLQQQHDIDWLIRWAAKGRGETCAETRAAMEAARG